MIPTEWTEDRPPTRAEALLAAARALTVRVTLMPLDPEVARAQADYSRAWTAIAALADDGPVPAPPDPVTLPPDAEMCHHGLMTMVGQNGRYHVTDMCRCYPADPQ